jgi:hypothetical protein
MLTSQLKVSNTIIIIITITISTTLITVMTVTPL